MQLFLAVQYIKNRLLSVAACVAADMQTKTWIRNTNFKNPKNWDKKRLPCAGDRVIFPSDANVGVLMPSGDTSVRELVLPFRGDILFPRYGQLLITGQQSSTSECDGEGKHFIDTDMQTSLISQIASATSGQRVHEKQVLLEIHMRLEKVHWKQHGHRPKVSETEVSSG